MQVSVWGTLSQVSQRFPLLSPLIWLILPPSLIWLMPRLLNLNRVEVRDRLARTNQLEHPDLFLYLLSDKKEPFPKEEWLLSHANVLIVASFDPIANVSSSVIYFLTKHPDKLHVLVKEIRESFGTYQEVVSETLQNVKYPQAVINEALRLHTNAAFGLPRQCPGTLIDGYLVPKGVIKIFILWLNHVVLL